MLNSKRRFLMQSGSFSQSAYGALLVFGLIAILTPFSAGGWAIAILGLLLLLAGVFEVLQGLRTHVPSSPWATYLTDVLMILVGLLLSGAQASPVITKAFLLPGDHSGRRDECQGILPAEPQPGQPHPEQTICCMKLRAADGLLIDSELAPQGHDLQLPRAACPKQLRDFGTIPFPLLLHAPGKPKARYPRLPAFFLDR